MHRADHESFTSLRFCMCTWHAGASGLESRAAEQSLTGGLIRNEGIFAPSSWNLKLFLEGHPIIFYHRSILCKLKFTSLTATPE